jgi:preprotein translocase subunit SecA
MAGRGTDIKLGEGVKEVGGLHILGTERHEARRIDRQLRGRAGRQGDPGSSQFFISLEDDLMRLFGGERMTRWMDKLGAADEVLEHSMLNKSVENAQKKVEENNFAIRKRLLEYDNVMNQQREVIYDRRRHALHGERLKIEIFDFVEEFADELLEEHFPDNIERLRVELRTKLLIDPEVDEFAAQQIGKPELKARILELAHEFYKRKEDQLGTEFMANLERYAVLQVIDDKWREHLRDMDELKEGIYLRQYGQKDPVLEYKREAFDLFRAMIREIDLEVIAFVFKFWPEQQTMRNAEPRQRPVAPAVQRDRSNVSTSRGLRFTHQSAAGLGLGDNPERAVEKSMQPDTAMEAAEAPQPVMRENPKIGRNDPCYCGSGKKFKHCHGQ